MWKVHISLLLLLSPGLIITAQKENYVVVRAPFSTVKYDEFSPVFYKGGIVFCSDMSGGVFSGYSMKDNKHFFKLYYADTSGFSSGRLLVGDINSRFNNGPATFNRKGDTMYFSRNLVVDGTFREVTDEGNKLGLFFAVLRNGRWTDVTEMRFNDKSWNVTTPYLSPDGKRLYFASDKPDGAGGSDLYYSEWKNGYWDNPVNLGNVINTSGNEAYPFVNEEGDLFFSSDGHKGMGGKDIFFTKYVDTAWIQPVGLNPPVNSSSNDFGFVADDMTDRGYFSSDRGKMLDIYYFTTIYPQFLYCQPMKSNSFCVSFSDDAVIDTDPLTMKFQWDMSNREKPSGYVVKHCFPGPGTYMVSEDIADKKTGRIIFNKLKLEVTIKQSVLPEIGMSGTAAPGSQVKFNLSAVSGSNIIASYWDFGDSENGTGPEISHVYINKGTYEVKLLTKLKDTGTGKMQQVCVSKMIDVSGNGEKKSNGAIKEKIQNPDNTSFVKIYSASDDISKRAVFAVEVMRSEKQLKDNDPVFKNISTKYNLRKVIFPGEKTFSYIVAEQTDFMSTYPAFNDILSAGFNDARIRTYMPSDSGEVDLWNFRRSYGTSSADYFMNNGTTISQHGITLLDRLVLLLRRNSRMKLIIDVHTDSATPDGNQLTLKQARSLGDYLINRGIEKSRIITGGLGSSQPVAPDYPESVRLKNRRIDFISAD